jgi:uncharacterized membrane protein YgcG
VIAVPAHKTSERGFALLIVFLLAAAVALMLYAQMPRVAFESERDKEQLLIDRGEQYKRGIQLYLQANRKFPSSLDDLEQRDKRYLRSRYVDPYTGKAEWRLIHSNGQALIDSLVQKPPDPNGTQTAAAPVTNPNDQPTVNAAVLSRPSDRPVTPVNGALFSDPTNPAYPGSQIADVQNPAFPPINLQQLQQQQQQQAGGLQVVPGAPGQPLPGQVAGQPVVAGLPLQPGVSPGFQLNSNGQIVAAGPAAPNAQLTTPGASTLINTLLTTARPPTPQPVSNPALLQNNNNTIGGGIAGVASSHEGPSIKVYNGQGTYADQQTYQTWEFIGQANGTGGGIPAGGGGGVPGGGPRPGGAPGGGGAVFGGGGGALPPIPAPGR